MLVIPELETELDNLERCKVRVCALEYWIDARRVRESPSVANGARSRACWTGAQCLPLPTFAAHLCLPTYCNMPNSLYHTVYRNVYRRTT